MSPEILEVIRLGFELGLIVVTVIFGAKVKKYKPFVKKLLEILQDVLDESEKEKVNKKIGKKIV